VVAVALALRVGDLSFRPLHNDEAINAFKLERLWTTGDYRYDPHEYHGPTFYYVAEVVGRVSAWVRGMDGSGPDEVGMRWVAVVASVGLVLVNGLFWGKGVLGVRAGWCGALGLAVSPAFVYYGRYFIHEMLLVLLTAVALGAGWRYVVRPGWGWAVLFGVAVGGMYATKETFVFNVLAMGVGGLGAAAWSTWRGNADSGCVGRPGFGARCRAWVAGLSKRDAGLAVGAAVVTAVVWFTSFFRHPEGALDAVRSYFIWLERAGGASPHIHPWWFYWERLGWFRERGGPLWTEAALFGMALVGGVMALWGSGRGGGDRRFGVFLVFYTLVLAGVYTVLPYKTPWCALGFHHGVVALAGWGLQEWLAWRRGWLWAGATAAVALAAAGHLGWQAWRANVDYAADFRNPYVYGHTSADVVNLLEQVREVAAADPAGRQVRVNVMAPESNYWPLPWYLRDFGQVGWWDGVPEDPYAPIMVVASRLKAGLEERSKQAWLMVGLFELRPRYFVELYVEAGLWERFLAARRAAREAGGG